MNMGKEEGPMPFYVTADHVCLYYEIRGKGKPVLLIHGLDLTPKYVPSSNGVFFL
jgi:hypothetical protein